MTTAEAAAVMTTVEGGMMIAEGTEAGVVAAGMTTGGGVTMTGVVVAGGTIAETIGAPHGERGRGALARSVGDRPALCVRAARSGGLRSSSGTEKGTRGMRRRRGAPRGLRGRQGRSRRDSLVRGRGSFPVSVADVTRACNLQGDSLVWQRRKKCGRPGKAGLQIMALCLFRDCPGIQELQGIAVTHLQVCRINCTTSQCFQGVSSHHHYRSAELGV